MCIERLELSAAYNDDWTMICGLSTYYLRTRQLHIHMEMYVHMYVHMYVSIYF